MKLLRLTSRLAIVWLVWITPVGRAADKEAIQKAIDRGVLSLKRLQQPTGTWPYTDIGATALAGLTLLECDLPAKDPAIQQAANAVRAACIPLQHTYSIALAILFFDRLGEERDIPLIESLAVRLLAGQNGNGGWSYQCPAIPQTEALRLTNLLRQRNELTTKVTGKMNAASTQQRQQQRKLTKEIQKQLININQQMAQGQFAGMRHHHHIRDDNSNTQFATLALWVARRHGVPTEEALARVNARFRISQGADGGWAYGFRTGMGHGGSSATMTCAGLLGLAVYHGVLSTTKTSPKSVKQRPGGANKVVDDPTRDPVIRIGLLALGTALGQPGGLNPGMPQFQMHGKLYYFLWSVERVAVAFGLQTIGRQDWYGWGAEVLVSTQQPDGSWQGNFASCGADTCFALLFLRRANLAMDLTNALRGKIKDPGIAVMKAGGVGGEALKRSAPQPLPISQDDSGTSVDADASKSAQKEKDVPAASSKQDQSLPRTSSTENASVQAAQWSKELVHALPDRQAELLARLRDSKGGVYTQALADAIPQLGEPAHKQAREALADRLTRMTAATLGKMLHNNSAEIRRAAALACAMKEERGQIPRLITLLEDSEPFVIHAAHAALKSLSGKDFGPRSDQRAACVQAVTAWKAWWKQQHP